MWVEVRQPLIGGRATYLFDVLRNWQFPAKEVDCDGAVGVTRDKIAHTLKSSYDSTYDKAHFCDRRSSQFAG
jgi:hypothetical protein